MSETLRPQVCVLGGGPGGYVAAIRAGQLGLDTVLVEADRLGGTCLIRGCIPSKALIHAADLYAEAREASRGAGVCGVHLPSPPELRFGETLAWKDGVVDRLSHGVGGLLKRARVRVVTGWATFSDAKTCRVDTGQGSVVIEAEQVILAAGSAPVELAGLPFGGKVISSTEALSLPEPPPTLAVIGGGYIGLELGIAFAKLGSKVTIVEATDRILPQYDAALTAPVAKWLRREGVEVHLGARAAGVVDDGLLIQTADGAAPLTVPADRILVTAGRRPRTEGWGLETMGLAMDGPFVKVDDRCAASTRGVWAIGDLVGEPMLAHKASAQGEMVAEILAGRPRRFDPVAIAAVCFTEPEIVSVGLSPDRAPDGVETLVGQFPFQANGRALSMRAGEDGGFVRVLARRSDHRILGLQAVGRHVSELAGQFATLMEMGAVLEDVAGVIHVHPTLGEAIHESALKALGHPLHA